MRRIGQIPARAGSKRVVGKNMRIMVDRPMIQYAIETALESKLDQVYVNSDSEEILTFAESLGAIPFARSKSLASDSATQDQFNVDFLQKVDCDAMVLVNPVCPLTPSALVDDFIDYSESNSLETCLTTVRYHLHAYFENQALNFDPNGQLPPTQELSPVEIISWNLAYWQRDSYLTNMEEWGTASTRGKLGLYPMNPKYALKVSTEDDFMFAEHSLRSKA